MLLRPQFEIISSIDDITSFRFAKRLIMIYWTAHRKEIQPIVVINNSLQIGSLGHKLSNKEKLYSSNYYFGDIYNPFINHSFGNVLSPDTLLLNKEAEVTFSNYSYIHKIYNWVSETEQTINIYESMFKDRYLLYNNDKFDKILPSDPRFYNLDHQLIKIRNDTPFVGLNDTYYGINRWNSYYLKDLIDTHTTVLFTQMIFDDPFNLMGTSEDIDYRIDTSSPYIIIYNIISRLINVAQLAFICSFSVYYDSEYGYNVKDIHTILSIPKEESRFELAQFIQQVQNEWECILDCSLNIRLNMTYSLTRTYIQVYPINHNSKIKNDNSIIKQKASDMDIILSDRLQSLMYGGD